MNARSARGPRIHQRRGPWQESPDSASRGPGSRQRSSCSAAARSGQLELAGPADRLAAASHRQLAADVLDVRLDALVGLTPAEQAVARLVATGRSNRQTTAEPFVSVKTVEFHLGHIYGKLGIRSRTDLIARIGRPAAVPAGNLGS